MKNFKGDSNRFFCRIVVVTRVHYRLAQVVYTFHLVTYDIHKPVRFRVNLDKFQPPKTDNTCRPIAAGHFRFPSLQTPRRQMRGKPMQKFLLPQNIASLNIDQTLLFSTLFQPAPNTRQRPPTDACYKFC